MDGCLIPQCALSRSLRNGSCAAGPNANTVVPVPSGAARAARPRLLGTPSFGTRLESAGCCRMRVVLGAVEGQEAIDRQGVQ